MSVEADNELTVIRRELVKIREMVTAAIGFMHNAEAEVPEHIRRFANYMHDLHHISWTYEERGHQAPLWIKLELQRCDDRFRQLLEILHKDGGAFEKIRREMSADVNNRWDHTRLLTTGATNETRTSDNVKDGLNQD